MRSWARVLCAAAGAIGALASVLASPMDGKATFQHRDDTMKRMGRPFYLGIGRVVKGTNPYGPDTVAAAEAVASIASTLDRTLFAPGSDVAESKIKPEIFSAGDRIDELILGVQKAVPQLVSAAKTGDKAAIAAAYTAVNNACNGCHSQFRRDE
jgi:cytochrome c556